MASKFIRHVACEKCGSSDANGLYDDGHTHCFACSHTTNGGEVVETPRAPASALVIPDGEARPIADRRITRATVEAFNVIVDDERHFYPYTDATGVVVAYKVREVATKKFHVRGALDSAVLFGQRRFAKGGKYVTITEGELDALAAFQMSGSTYPVVSIRTGAKGALKDCKANFEWLDSFDSIVLCFDGDAPGTEAAREVSELFGSKVKVFKHSGNFKDACDYLKAGETELFVKSWWKAETYRPEGVVTVRDIKARILQPKKAGIPWAFPAMTKLTYGRRAGEIYIFGAGVGIGKTDVFTQQIAYDISVLKERVGVIYLEQPVEETVTRVAGKIDGKRYHLPTGDYTREEFEARLTSMEEEDRLHMMEHSGAKSWNEIKPIIRYFAKALDIKMIYLDHLTALSANEEDERRALDRILADMASVAQETGIVLHLISHLTTPEGKSHEEGGRVLEKQFTGSRAIARWGHYLFGLERNKQDADHVKRSTLTVRVLKDRFAGDATGETFALLYDKDTGRLEDVKEEVL